MDFYDAWDYAERERKRSRDLEREQKIARLKRESAATSSKPDSGERSRELVKEQKIAQRKREPAATSSKPDSGETEEQKIARWKREPAATSSKPDSSDHADDLEVRVVVFYKVENVQILRYYFLCLSFRSYSLATGTDGPCYLFAEEEYGV